MENLQAVSGEGDVSDSVKANLEGVPCGGHGATLYVIGSSGPSLSAISVNGCRLCWRKGSYPYTAFIRNRNLTRTPRSCRGMLCVYRTNKGFRLGVIGNLSPLWNDTITLYEWTGFSIMDSGVFTPEFMYFARSLPLHFDTIKSHFKLIQVRSEEIHPSDIVFVNTVSSHPEVPLLHNCVNPNDGCFEMSSVGPDVMVQPDSLPHVHNLSPMLRTGDNRFDSINTDFVWNRSLPKESPFFLLESRRILHHLPSIFRTILSESGCPLMESGSFVGKIAVPYVVKPTEESELVIDSFLEEGIKVKFGFINRHTWRSMVGRKSMSISEHNTFLFNNATAELCLEVLQLKPEQKGGVRVSVATKAELDPFVRDGHWNPHGRGHFSCPSFTKRNEDGPGNVVIRYAPQREVRPRLLMLRVYPLLI